MAKRFNITGICFPEQHYMADVANKFQQAKDLVDLREYFAITGPRQFGKTTTLFSLADILRKTGEYIVLNTSFEGLGDAMFEDEKTLSMGLIRQWAKHIRLYDTEWADWVLEQMPKAKKLDAVGDIITPMLNKTDKKVVLMIDEVDKSSNNQLFVSFLAMLRNKYLSRDTFKNFSLRHISRCT